MVLIVTTLISIMLTTSSISESFYSYLRVRAITKDSPSKRNFYLRFLQFICWFDIVVAGAVIILTSISCFNSGNPAKMLLSAAGIKIIADIDDFFAKYYMKFYVKIT